MLRIELAALSAQELKRLLEMARARNQGALAEQLLAELESRPQRVEDWAPLPMSYAPPTAYEPAEAHTARRRSGAMAATAAIAAFVSAAVTWGISVPPAARDPAPEQPAPRAAVVLASLEPASPPPGFAEPSPPEARAAEPEARDPGGPPVRVARATASARSRSNPCYDLTTAAERLVCGYPSLAAQDRQLRAAYDRALSAGADRRDLDRGQALWREASQNVSDRQALSERYARRIRELEAAATPPPPPPPPASPPEDPPF
jgi:hypothetical protein